MKRLISQAAALVAVGAVLGSAGCVNSTRESLQSRYTERVDPCVPERYSYQAREATLAPFAAQVGNAQILDSYLQNGDFEDGTAVLTQGGQVKLDSLTRKRPVNPHVYIQTARDVRYDAAKPAEYASTAADLNAKRTEATLAYLHATTAGRGLNFDVTVIDPADQRMPAAGPANAVRGFPQQFQSGINGITNTAQLGLGGAAAAATIAPGAAVVVPQAGGGVSGPAAAGAAGAPAGGTGSVPSGR